ncbi:hypothetical protein GWN42_09790, partial [candidate division KSB1 bacterium]|nr:hypothetical protein [candidate division KSB1 bacterium]
MSRPKLVVYSQGLSNCPCFQDINNTFKAEWAYTKKQFLSRIKRHNPDAAVVCFCSSQKEDAEELLQLDAITGSLPVLTCSRNLTLDFVIAAAELGANRFLCCEWKMTKIDTVIRDAIRLGELKEFLAVQYPESLSASPYIGKMLNEMMQASPKRLRESEVAQTLGISPR